MLKGVDGSFWSLHSLTWAHAMPRETSRTQATAIAFARAILWLCACGGVKAVGCGMLIERVVCDVVQHQLFYSLGSPEKFVSTVNQLVTPRYFTARSKVYDNVCHHTCI